MPQQVVFIFIVLLAFSCSDSDPKKFDCAKSDLAVSLVSISPASSCSVADGKIIVAANGGKEPFNYFLNDGVAQATGEFTNVSSGIYSITIQDKNGCQAVLSDLSVLAAGFKFTSSVTANTKCLGGNGAITIDVQEGNAPYRYKLGSGEFSDKNTFSSLRQGTYTVFIEDAAACTVQISVTIPRGNTATSWSTEVLPIIKTSCAVNGCHDGKTRTDYRIYDNAKREAAQIKKLTRDKSMPFDGPALSQTQIDLISCWVDDGAVNN